MKRRGLLLLGAAWCGTARAATPAQALLDLFDDPATARLLGRAYLASLANPPSAEALTQSVWQDLPGPAPLREQVANLIHRDFEAGRLACADGWLLAHTEAQLCALAALMTPTG